MKKYTFLFLLIITALILPQTNAFGQTKTTPTSAVTQQQIDELKTKIASKVAELKLVEKRGVLGIVKDSSDTQITITDQNGNIKNIDVDELTKFYSSDTSFGISDIKKGQTIGVLGLFNRDSRRLQAREVNDISPLSKIEFGTILSIDKDNYEIIVLNNNKQKLVFEIEDTTKTYSFISGDLVKSGFSKLEENQAVVITGNTDKQSKDKFLTSRIILLPNVNFKTDTKTTDSSVISATGSGLKIDNETK